MTQPWTVDQCKSILFKLGIKYGVAPKIISERLLSKEDKEDMLNGLISLKTFDCMIKTWKEGGMCNYADGSGGWYSDFNFHQCEGKGSP